MSLRCRTASGEGVRWARTLAARARSASIVGETEAVKPKGTLGILGPHRAAFRLVGRNTEIDHVVFEMFIIHDCSPVANVMTMTGRW